jgi:octaprenyl-diphosphate synthase
MSLVDRERIKLAALQKIIGPELKRFDSIYDELVSGEHPLIEVVCAHVKQGRSKRFRPTLLMLTAKGDAPLDEHVIRAAACVEMIHTATLLHDDIIDESLTRRGMPSVNNAWDTATALVMGDYLYSKALDCLSRFGLHDALRHLSDTTVKMSEAEMIQIQTRNDLHISEATYLEIIYKKTASLIESACRIGAAFNPRASAHEAAYGEFGRKVGFVFQITDDIFDYSGDSRRLGKPTGQDWEEGRVTLPLIAALRSAPDDERRALLEHVEGMSAAERRAAWPRLKTFVDFHGGIDTSRDLARRYGEEAKAALADVAAGAQEELLTVAVDYVLKRLN